VSFDELARFPRGAEWIARAPRLAAECADRWSLELGEPYAYANVSLVFPAGDVVLKVSFPHWESEHEAAALRHWDGDGAIRLVDYDAERNALLLERCVPGTSLLELPEEEGFR
jgi:streptomycin 6-kinase